jgi:hypothetical protein
MLVVSTVKCIVVNQFRAYASAVGQKRRLLRYSEVASRMSRCKTRRGMPLRMCAGQFRPRVSSVEGNASVQPRRQDAPPTLLHMDKPTDGYLFENMYLHSNFVEESILLLSPQSPRISLST